MSKSTGLKKVAIALVAAVVSLVYVACGGGASVSGGTNYVATANLIVPLKKFVESTRSGTPNVMLWTFPSGISAIGLTSSTQLFVLTQQGTESSFSIISDADTVKGTLTFDDSAPYAVAGLCIFTPSESNVAGFPVAVAKSVTPCNLFVQTNALKVNTLYTLSSTLTIGASASDKGLTSSQLRHPSTTGGSDSADVKIFAAGYIIGKVPVVQVSGAF